MTNIENIKKRIMDLEARRDTTSEQEHTIIILPANHRGREPTPTAEQSQAAYEAVLRGNGPSIIIIGDDLPPFMREREKKK